MNEPVSGTHPDSAELQGYADGEAQSERVASHVESCAICREEVAAIRRVTAALSLGSRPPDSLTERVRTRRAAPAQAVPVIPLRRTRMRARNFVLPIGLAAAAALAIFVPRALREPSREESPSPAGAKGVLPADMVVFEAVVTETGSTSIDSISWDLSGPAALKVELRYVAGVAESPRAERLAGRAAEQLRAAGIDATSITVNSVRPEAAAGSLPAGAVAVIIRWRGAPTP